METSDVFYDPSSQFRRCGVISRTGLSSIYQCEHVDGYFSLWNEFYLEGSTESGRKALFRFFVDVGPISHPNFINFFRAWYDKSRNVFVYITEQFTSKTLQKYVWEITKAPPSKAVLGNWIGQIIDGLEQINNKYMHGGVRCDNIFIDGSDGVVKIGPPNLEMLAFGTQPELSAPEFQISKMEPKCDVWALGIMIVELMTNHKPYEEYDTLEAKRNAILKHIMPQAISDVSDPVIADFVETCLLPFQQRPSMSQLREHLLISDFNSNIERSFGSLDFQEKQIMDEQTIKQTPEFIELLKKQQIEKNELLIQQKKERKAKRSAIRESSKKSLRQLLDEEIPSNV